MSRHSADYDAPRCWCGGAVGPRDPGDENGLGCLEDIWHIWRETTAPKVVRLSRGHVKDETGICQPVETYEVPITYDPDLIIDGEPVKGYADLTYRAEAITLREWNEQVLLHEVLHLLVNRFIPPFDYHGHPTRHHEAVREIEVALTTAGWRFCPSARDIPPAKTDGAS